MEKNTTDYGVSSYRWNPPTYTPEEAERARRWLEEYDRESEEFLKKLLARNK